MTPPSSDRYGLVQEAIAQQRCVILDGGVATELPHRHGQDHERLWGIEALRSDLDEVRGVHRRYAEAGADAVAALFFAFTPDDVARAFADLEACRETAVRASG